MTFTQEDLIGKSFKRDEYGLSTWTDTIQDVWVIWNLHIIDGEHITIPEFMIKGTTIHHYKLSEIVLIGWDFLKINYNGKENTRVSN